MVCRKKGTLSAGRFGVCALILLATAVTGNARPKDDAVTVHYSRTTGLASFVTARDNVVQPTTRFVGPVPDRSRAILRRHGHLFGIADPDRQLQARSPRTDSLGHTHTKYEQFHGGVRVFAGVVNTHLGPDGGLIAVNGDFFPIPDDFDTQPRLDQEAAVAVARATVEADGAAAEHVELVIVDPGWYGDPPIGPHLVYYIILSDPRVPLREALFIDAQSGKVLDRWDVLHTARFRRVFDGQGTETVPGPLLVRSEGQGPVFGSHPDVDRAFDYGGDVYDYYARAFGRDSLDDNGLELWFTVNWMAVSVCPNAFWDSFLQQMVFCDGTVTDDITAHEMTHGVVDHTAMLIFQNQSGQLNESFADVFGELVDLFNGNAAFAGTPGGSPTWPVELPRTDPGLDAPNDLRTACSDAFDYVDGVRWLVGEDAATAFNGVLRDMWDPTCFGDPDRANSPLQTCPSFDFGGVHFGSGIPNHAFAMLTDGKTFNGQTVTGIGPIKSAAVWYRALTRYLTPASDFEDAYAALNQAALDLIGTTPLDPRTGLPSSDVFTAFDAEQVEKALRAVEMNTPGRCGRTTNDVLDTRPAIQCANRTTIFLDDFEAGGNRWTVSVTGPAGPPPTLYDWELTNVIPLGRTGTAWYGADRNIGNCDTIDESAVHSLISPEILLPGDAAFPMLSFTHYMSSEAGWDGGNVSIQVNGGPWELVPGTAFLFHPYNAELNRTADFNTNPMAGLEAWTGPGGTWGMSVVDLSGFAGAGQPIRLRFEFGKDGCFGVDGWYIDDLEVYDCPDCDGTGAPDHRDFVFTAASGPLGNIGAGSPRTFAFPAPEASGDVTISFVASADLGSSSEYIDVDLGGSTVGTVFQFDAFADCPLLSNSPANLAPFRAELTVPAATFNASLVAGSAQVNLTASSQVNPRACRFSSVPVSDGKSYIAIFVQYDVATADCSGNLIPDACEPDEDLDRLVDACDSCPGTIPTATVDPEGCPPLVPGDFERDGDVDLINFGAWKACLSGPAQPLIPGCDAMDLSGDGRVDVADFRIFQGCFSSENQPGDPACTP